MSEQAAIGEFVASQGSSLKGSFTQVSPLSKFIEKYLQESAFLISLKLQVPDTPDENPQHTKIVALDHEGLQSENGMDRH